MPTILYVVLIFFFCFLRTGFQALCGSWKPRHSHHNRNQGNFFFLKWMLHPLNLSWPGKWRARRSLAQNAVSSPILVYISEKRVLYVVLFLFRILGQGFDQHSSILSTAGTAILSKHKPLSVDQKIPGHPDPDSIKGRIITLEFESCFLVGTYVVNAGQGLKVGILSLLSNISLYWIHSIQTLAEKQTWNTHFFKYLTELDKKKPVIWAGDFNVAPQAIGQSIYTRPVSVLNGKILPRSFQRQKELEQNGWIHRGRDVSL